MSTDVEPNSVCEREAEYYFVRYLVEIKPDVSELGRPFRRFYPQGISIDSVTMSLVVAEDEPKAPFICKGVSASLTV